MKCKRFKIEQLRNAKDVLKRMMFSLKRATGSRQPTERGFK